MRQTFRELCAGFDVPPQAADDFELALCEAFSNAVLYGSPRHDSPVQILMRVTPRRCSVVLEYPGEPFTLSPPRLPDSASTGGRGRYLMATLTDEVKYEFRQGVTRVRLTKRLS